jgi:hypothetical protein
MYQQPAKYIANFFVAVQEHFIAYSRCRETAVTLQPSDVFKSMQNCPFCVHFTYYFRRSQCHRVWVPLHWPMSYITIMLVGYERRHQCQDLDLHVRFVSVLNRSAYNTEVWHYQHKKCISFIQFNLRWTVAMVIIGWLVNNELERIWKEADMLCTIWALESGVPEESHWILTRITGLRAEICAHDLPNTMEC